MNEYRFTLDSKRGKYTCPSCDSESRFSRYFDTLDMYQFPDNVGKCDRVNSCGYHKSPSDFFADNPEEYKIAYGEHKSNRKADNRKPYIDRKRLLLSYMAEIETCAVMASALYAEVSQKEPCDIINTAEYCEAVSKVQSFVQAIEKTDDDILDKKIAQIEAYIKKHHFETFDKKNNACNNEVLQA